MAGIPPPVSNPFSTPASASSTPGLPSGPSSATSLTDTSTSTTTSAASTSSVSSTSDASSASSTSDTSSATSSAATSSSTSASSASQSSSSTSSVPSSSSIASTPSSGPSAVTSAPPATSHTSASVYASTESDGSVVQVTSYVVVGPTPTNTLAAQDAGSSKGFFENKGAVAGVFTVVGLIALVLGIAFITNAIRRRRARKFDQEIAEAAREAAHAGARPPDLDDDDDFAFGGRSVYTDGTHGAYAQAPLKHLETYNMSELPLTSDPAYGAGHAGVGAAGLNRARSTNQPYNAFAGPPGAYQPPPPPVQGDTYFDAPPVPNAGYPDAYQSRGPNAGILDAAGLGAGAALARGPSQHAQYGATTLARNQSLGGARAMDGYGDPYAHGAYPPQPQPPQQPQWVAPQAAAVQHYGEQQHQPYDQHQHQQYDQQQHSYAPPPPPPQQQQLQRPVSGVDDAYGGYADTFVVAGEHDNEQEHEREHESDDDDAYDVRGYAPYAHESRASVGDDEDYGYGGGRRVLKVANE